MLPTSLIELYRDAFRKHGNSPDAVLWPKGRQRLRFSRLTSHILKDGFSLLDFGCGLGHLKSYLDTRFSGFRYSGVDLVPEFIAECQKNFPDCSFKRIDDAGDIADSYDYVVMSGVFNILYVPDLEQHLQKVCDTLGHLFRHTRVALSCDFMTDKVDFKGPGAFHMSEPALVEIIRDRLSARYSIDHTYMPYEFSVTVYRDQRISRPGNVYFGTPDEDPKG
jgi:SAM-dependent methyltransferase